jgi:ATP-dependent Lon protease
MEKMEEVSFVKERLRFLIVTRRKLKKCLNRQYSHIFSVMYRINRSSSEDILSQNKVYLNTVLLEEALELYTEIYENLYRVSIGKALLALDTIREKIQTAAGNCGAETLDTLLDIALDISIHDIKTNKTPEFNKLVDFFNRMYVPMSYKIYPRKTEMPGSGAVIVTNESSLEDSVSFDHYNIADLNFPKCKMLQKKQMSILEHINGSRMYIPIPQLNRVFVMNGYFLTDSLNISRIGGTIGRKHDEILKSMEGLSIDESFKSGYLNQMSLRDFLVLSNNEIVDTVIRGFHKLQTLKDKTISSLVKEFLGSEVHIQREILTLFLLVKDNLEIQYLAYLMYDMISNESYLLKPQPLAEQVYNSLHWSVQRIFKNAVKTVTNYTKSILEFTEEDIPYEKRIFLMKVPKSVKVKAMDKYKEIINKGTDSSTKSQQYLDGLLRIPFGVYCREPILQRLAELKTEFTHLVSQDTSASGFTDGSALEPVMNSSIEKYIKTTKCFANVDEILAEVKKMKLSELRDLTAEFNTVNSQKLFMKNWTKGKIVNVIGEIVMEYRDFFVKSLMSNPGLDNTAFLSFREKWNSHKNDSREYIRGVRETLDKAVFKQDTAKREIERIIAQWISGDMKGYCFGFEGPPGTGKTSLAKKGIAKCLTDSEGKSRPFAFIAVGGSSNSSTLEGHSYTYVGSTWGKIVDILIETKCMNPIIYIDELDKISKTENGKEIIGILTHITDSTQNDQFNDKYFSGIDIDLSKVLFIFSYNDFSLLDPILADRIHRVRFKHLSKRDKITIIEDYILPEILEMVGFSRDSVKFADDTIEFIITSYTFEAGVRKLKEKVFEIIREINLEYITEKRSYEFPIIINVDKVRDIFSNKSTIQFKKIAPGPCVGLVNGLYATTSGIGGITIIEVFKTLADSKLSMVLTGQQGDVMKESMSCAKTIAWNLIPKTVKDTIKKDWDDNGAWGIHIHCPEAATPKDGPSAGCAITTAIVSILTGIAVRNTVAMTGEIDLNGSARQIGGLDIKIDGAKSAGVEKVLVPRENAEDLDIIKLEKPDVLENIEIVIVDNIWQVLEHTLVENDIDFQKY